jgi:hypothetical protein
MGRAEKTAAIGLVLVLVAILAYIVTALAEGPPLPADIRESCDEFCGNAGCVLVEIRGRLGRADCICAVADHE